MVKLGIRVFLVFLFVGACAFDSNACSTCLGVGTIEKRETCRVCSGNRKIRESVTKTCDRCNGKGSYLYRMQGTKYGQSKWTNCRKCNGRGTITVKEYIRCPECNGTGSQITRIPCPKCKGRSAGNNQGAVEPKRNVKMVAVEKCPLCKNGSIETTTICDICEKGYCHKKKDGKYFCRKCGEECDGRFVPCPCGKPDCIRCGGVYNKVEKKPCGLCNGDGIVTPLERMKYEKK